MKRRNFIQLSLYAGAAVSISYVGCTGSEVAHKPWVQPELLSHICDTKTIKEIGAAYREKFTNERKEQQLIGLLLKDANNNEIPVNSENAVVHSLLEQKIKSDFENGRTVIVKGWVLAETEARQCALFSLTNH